MNNNDLLIKQALINFIYNNHCFVYNFDIIRLTESNVYNELIIELHKCLLIIGFFDKINFNIVSEEIVYKINNDVVITLDSNNYHHIKNAPLAWLMLKMHFAFINHKYICAQSPYNHHSHNLYSDYKNIFHYVE